MHARLSLKSQGNANEQTWRAKARAREGRGEREERFRVDEKANETRASETYLHRKCLKQHWGIYDLAAFCLSIFFFTFFSHVACELLLLSLFSPRCNRSIMFVRELILLLFLFLLFSFVNCVSLISDTFVSSFRVRSKKA
ncbi:hypothetical protein EYR41_000583 [Orbilia oligospora]|uniref:Transmembrane protein n=1 Tax=Orbilia oligospora TaxID=2813651 RepID=A0A8H2E6K8_ORBOL|nr:hypothetical protein EYR41_000583 [Orbilia oligospora]